MEKSSSKVALTWEETSFSLLCINIRELWLSGVWPLPGSKLFSTFSAIVWVLGVENFIESIVGIYFSGGDVETITLLLANTFTTGGGFVKMSFFLMDPHKYSVLVRLMEEMISDLSNYGNQKIAIVMKRTRRTALVVSFYTYALASAQIFIWYPMPLIAYPGQGKLPFIQHPWINSTTFPAYETMYTLQCLSSGFHIFINFGMDCFFAVVMTYTAACLMVLRLRITDLRVDCQQWSVSDIGRCSENGVSNNQDDIYSKLQTCVRSHQTIIGFVSYLQTVMSPIAMTQFAFSVVSACVVLFQATYSQDSKAAYRCASFLPTPGTQVFLYCWAAHNLMEQGEAVSAAAYGSSWIEANTRFKRILKIIMCRAQKPLLLKAGHLYPINREAFLSLVNASYSYYALLGQVQNR